MKIATILPYKENYTKKGAGAVSLWIHDFMNYSKFKKDITVFGNTNNKNFLTNNYINIKLDTINSKIYSSTNEYSNNIIKYLKNTNFNIIEIHNRPNMIQNFIKRVKSKIILYFHNDPGSMKGSKTIKDKIFLLENVDKIIFISKWVKKKFFEDLNFNDHNKTEIIYHSINPIKKIYKKKKKQIIFIGKLNQSKGYDLFCEALIEVLNKYDSWKAFSAGDEKRFQPFKTHKRHLNLGLLSNKEALKLFEVSEIAVIPSRWEEPFGRTALESSSRGCATIISDRGGLPETTDDAFILNKLNKTEIIKILEKLINNKRLRTRVQLSGLKNVKHTLERNSKKIDYTRSSLFPFSNFNSNNGKIRIINIYNLAQKLNHRIYNLSIGKKFTNGFIRNGHDVLEISDRDFIKQFKSLNPFNYKDKFRTYLLETCKNYNPDLLIFGHSNNLNPELLDEFKSINQRTIISQWNEDPLMKNSKISKNNSDNLKSYFPFTDHIFITTSPDSTNLEKSKFENINFIMPPVDRGIECFDIYNLNPKNDLFYAISHGVNRAKLKSGKLDNRLIFIKKLINKIKNIKYDFYGVNNKEPIWGDDFYRAITNSKMGLNLSRGTPTKHYSSNRIATFVGNGLLTFIDEKVKMDTFFKKDELIFYSNLEDLVDKINFYSRNNKSRIKISKKGQKKYFKLFNEKKISKYIVDISLGKLVNLY